MIFWQYDPDQNFWTQKAELPGTPRNSAVAFEAGGKGYVGTGYDGTNKLKDFWEYDLKNNTGSRRLILADLPDTTR